MYPSRHDFITRRRKPDVEGEADTKQQNPEKTSPGFV
jgi:hypothetical protein